MEDRAYAAITADIVGSTEYYKANGKPLRPRLLEALAKLNARHADALAVPFAITLGDEVQGLVTNPADAPRVVHDLRLQLSPLKCRIGTGIGPIVSELAESTSQMEGLAFSFSREALDQMKKAKVRATGYRMENGLVEETANTIASLTDIIQSRWTDKQWEAVRLYAELGDQASVGKRLGVSAQGAEHRLRSTQWREIETSLETLSDLLRRITEHDLVEWR